MAHSSPIQIQKYLKGVDYPASKQDLIRNARKNALTIASAPHLSKLPYEDFQTPADVSQAFKGPSEDNVRGSRKH